MAKQSPTPDGFTDVRHSGFLENYPFTVFIERGWTFETVSAPRARSHRPTIPVWTVRMRHEDLGRFCVFDIDPHGHMSDHATFDHPDFPDVLIAETPSAAAALAMSPPEAHYTELAALRDITTRHP